MENAVAAEDVGFGTDEYLEAVLYLHDAALQGEVDHVEKALGRIGVRGLEEKDEDGFTPLLLAAESGHVDVVQFLLRVKASVDHTSNDGSNALTCAVHGGSEQIVQLLVQAKSSISDNDVLTAAILDGNVTMVQKFLNLKAVISHTSKSMVSSSPLQIALDTGRADIIELVTRAAKKTDESETIRPPPATLSNSQETIEQLQTKLSDNKAASCKSSANVNSSSLHVSIVSDVEVLPIESDSASSRLSKHDVVSQSDLFNAGEVIQGGCEEIRSYIEQLAEQICSDERHSEENEFAVATCENDESYPADSCDFQHALTVFEQLRKNLAFEQRDVKDLIRIQYADVCRSILDLSNSAVQVRNNLLQLLQSDQFNANHEIVDVIRNFKLEKGVSKHSTAFGLCLDELGELASKVKFLSLSHKHLKMLRDVEYSCEQCRVTILATVHTTDRQLVAPSNEGQSLDCMVHSIDSLLQKIKLAVEQCANETSATTAHMSLQYITPVWLGRLKYLISTVRKEIEAKLVFQIKARGWPGKISLRQGENLDSLISNPNLLDELDAQSGTTDSRWGGMSSMTSNGENNDTDNSKEQKGLNILAEHILLLVRLQKMDEASHSLLTNANAPTTLPLANKDDDLPWFSQLLWKPVERRLRFHFGLSKSSRVSTAEESGELDNGKTSYANRVDKPEWFLYYVIRILHGADSFFDHVLRPICDHLIEKSEFHKQEVVSILDFDWFAIACFRFVRGYFSWIWQHMDSVSLEPDLLCHTVQQVLKFERLVHLRDYVPEEAGQSVERLTKHLRDLLNVSQNVQPENKSSVKKYSKIARGIDALLYNGTKPPLLLCSKLMDLPPQLNPSKIMKLWLQAEYRRLFDTVKKFGRTSFEASKEADQSWANYISHWSLTQTQAVAAKQQTTMSEKFTNGNDHWQETKKLALPLGCIAYMSALAEAVDICGAFPAGEGQLLVESHFITPLLQSFTQTLQDGLHYLVKQRETIGKRFWLCICALTNSITAMRLKLQQIESQPLGLHLADLRSVYIKSTLRRNSMANISKANKNPDSHRGHGFVGGLIGLAKGLHSAAEKVADHVRERGFKQQNKSETINKQQTQDVADQDKFDRQPVADVDEIVQSQHEMSQMNRNNAQKMHSTTLHVSRASGHNGAANVLRSIGTSLGSLGEKLGGSTLRTIGTASTGLEALGGRTINAVSKANRWLRLHTVATKLGPKMIDESQQKEETGHVDEIQISDDDDNVDANFEANVTNLGSSDVSSVRRRPNSNDSVNAVTDIDNISIGIFDEHVRVFDRITGEKYIRMDDDEIPVENNIASILADAVFDEFAGLSTAYASSESIWVEAVAPPLTFGFNDRVLALPISVSEQVHDAIAQLRFRLNGIQSMLQAKTVALAAGRQLSKMLHEFIFTRVLWNKPFSRAGAGQLAVDVCAIVIAISSTLGFGKTKNDRDWQKGFENFIVADKILSCNPCFREVQECLRLLVLPVDVLVRMCDTYDQVCPIISRNAPSYTALMNQPDSEVMEFVHMSKLNHTKNYSNATQSDAGVDTNTTFESLDAMLAGQGVRRLGIFRSYPVIRSRIDLV